MQQLGYAFLLGAALSLLWSISLELKGIREELKKTRLGEKE